MILEGGGFLKKFRAKTQLVKIIQSPTGIYGIISITGSLIMDAQIHREITIVM